MAGRRKFGNKRTKENKRGDDQALTNEEIRQRAPPCPCPFAVDLILQLIFSSLEIGDLLRVRLVAKNWTPLATEECRDRKLNFPWIGREEEVEEVDDGKVFILDEGSALGFMDVMTPSLPRIPVQQIALRLDLLSIDPDTLLSLLSFMAPWVKTLRLVAWCPMTLDVESPLLGQDGRKAMTWSAALNSFPPLDFPRLETLEIGEKGGFRKTLQQTLAMFLVNLVAKIVKGARGLQGLGYWTRFFVDGVSNDGLKDAEKEASKVILQGLAISLERVDVGYNCEVDYGTLTTLHLSLEKFVGCIKPGPGAFLEFLEGQKTGLKRLHLPNLEDLYDSSKFPILPFVTELLMWPNGDSAFECLKAFPTLLTLQINMGWWDGEPRGQDELSHLPAHPTVRKLVVSGYFLEEVTMPFTLIKHVLPNLTHVDFTSMEGSDNLTQLFTHLPRLVSLKLSLNDLRSIKGLQSLLSGLRPSLLKLAKDFDISDAEAFQAVEVIGSRRGNSTVGLANLKDLQVLDISESAKECYEVFLSKLTFGTVFMKMRSLKEIRIAGKLPKACKPVLEALMNKGIHVRVYKVKE